MACCCHFRYCVLFIVMLVVLSSICEKASAAPRPCKELLALLSHPIAKDTEGTTPSIEDLQKQKLEKIRQLLFGSSEETTTTTTAKPSPRDMMKDAYSGYVNFFKYLFSK